MIKDHILLAVPSKMANFLMEQRAGDLHDLESKGTAYYDANKNIFARGLYPELHICAVAEWQGKQQNSKFKIKCLWINPRQKGPKGATITCKFCRNQHGEKEWCDSSPEGKNVIQKHIKYIKNKSHKLFKRKKCFCCHVIGHEFHLCPCKEEKVYGNVSVGNSSESSELYYDSSESESAAMAAEIIGVQLDE